MSPEPRSGAPNCAVHICMLAALQTVETSWFWALKSSVRTIPWSAQFGTWYRARGAMLDALGKRDKDSDLPIPLGDLISAAGPAWKWT